MTTSNASLNKPKSPPTSVMQFQLLRQQTNTGTSTTLTTEALWSTCTRLRALFPTCGINLGSLTLPRFEAGDFVELILLCIEMSSSETYVLFVNHESITEVILNMWAGKRYVCVYVCVCVCVCVCMCVCVCVT